MELERASLTDEYGDELVMTGWSLKGDLYGMAFEANLEQSFVNSTGNHAEIVYNFPLPWGAEILGLDAQVGDKRLTGVVIGKKESEAKYEEAMSEGDSAILLEKNAESDYTLNLGGVKPNEKVIITVRYAELLRFTKSGLRLCVPTVISPRFGDPINDGGLKQHQVAESSLLAEYTFGLEITLHGDWEDAALESPSHSIKISGGEQGSRVISLSKTSFLDRDFVLSLEKPSQSSVAMVVPDYADSSNSMILAAFRPDLANGQPKPVNVKILVDCSGSMAGDSIEAARASLQAFVQELTEHDHFSLSKFGNMFMHRSKGLWTATEPAKLAAQRWIASLEADMGGTAMGPALMDTFELASKEPADVLLVTDGDIHAIEHVIKLAKESKHRLFIVGIGSAPSETTLRRMAEETMGACDFVAPGEDVGPAVTNMFARLRSSAAHGLSFCLPQSGTPTWIAPMERIAYDGDTVYVFTRVEGKPEGVVSLSGVKDDGAEVLVGSVVLPPSSENKSDLSRLAVAAYLHKMIDCEGRTAGAWQKMAEDYQLVTDCTNFFMLVDRAEDKADVMPELHKVAQMMPAGFGGFGSTSDVSIRASRARFSVIEPLRACSMGDATPFGDFSQYDLPPGMRSARFSMRMSPAISNLKVEDFVSQGVDHYDIPAFLRKDGSGEKEASVWTLDVQDARLYNDTIEYEGLTPLGTYEWVRHKTVNEWPTTYSGLLAIGVPEAIVDWLELLIARENESGEASVIASFLYAFLSPTIEQLLSKSVVEYESKPKGKDKFLVSHDLNRIDVDAYVYSDVIKAMNQSEASGWPNCMFDMQLA